MTSQIRTPTDCPNHHAIGRLFYGWDQQVYYCDSYDPRADYWMTNVVDSTKRRHAVSPRAIGRTYHCAGDDFKPQTPADVTGRDYYLVDTRVPPEQMAYTKTTDKDCLNTEDRVALFFYEGDARKFITRVHDAAARLAADVEGKA